MAATLARPAIEWMLKATVDRPRPDLERLVPGNGPSFPTGHVLAAVAIYGLLPLVVGLYTRRRWLWWSSVGMAGAVIFLVGASRVYLGVHWLSDVVGSMVLASFFLLGVEWVLHRSHDLDACAPCPAPGAVERPG
ncbi:MAG: phosphatase PAP2 family protein [Acidimicrobiia bacterium]|nr:phosphatase PAP2 family protein [Acidimicrobiia bacterium]